MSAPMEPNTQPPRGSEQSREEPAELQPILEAIREVVRAADCMTDDTEVVETDSYGMPTKVDVDAYGWNGLAETLALLRNLIPDSEDPAQAGHAVTLVIDAFSTAHAEGLGKEDSSSVDESAARRPSDVCDQQRGDPLEGGLDACPHSSPLRFCAYRPDDVATCAIGLNRCRTYAEVQADKAARRGGC